MRILLRTVTYGRLRFPMSLPRGPQPVLTGFRLGDDDGNFIVTGDGVCENVERFGR